MNDRGVLYRVVTLDVLVDQVMDELRLEIVLLAAPLRHYSRGVPPLIR